MIFFVLADLYFYELLGSERLVFCVCRVCVCGQITSEHEKIKHFLKRSISWEEEEDVEKKILF